MSKFIGKSHLTTRTVTGFRSLDLAFPQFSKTGEVKVGIPNNIPYLAYGLKGMGKSTLCTTMAGIIAGEQNKDIALRSIEGFDSEWTGAQLDAVGFDGNVRLAEGMDTEEYNLDLLLGLMRSEDVAVGILDSIAGIQPEAEVNAKSIVEVQMGRRAQITNKLMRHVTNLSIWRGSPLAFFGITHEYKSYSQYEPSTKPGGDGKQYLTRVHIKVGREKWAKDMKYILDDGSFIIKGTIEQFNYGIKGKEFWIFILANFGAHRGMSAVFDAIQYGVAQRKRGRIVCGEWNSTLSEMLKHARSHEDEFFEPVVTAMSDIYTVQKKAKEEEE